MKKFNGMLMCILAAMLLTACEHPEQEDSDLTVATPEQSTLEISLGQETVAETTVGGVSEPFVEERTNAGQEQGTEEITETSGENVTLPTQTGTQAETMEVVTVKETEAATEKTTPAPTEKVTQAPTQPPTEPPTEPPTQAPTEPAIPAEMASRVENSMWIYGDYIQSVIGLVNAKRKDSGLAPLQYDATLCKVATYRCIEIIDNDMFSHTRPDGTPCYTLFDAYGVVYCAAGENLAAGQRSPEEVVTDWINSPGHRANILGDYTNIGVGIAIDPAGCLYWAQSFIKVKK